MSPCRLCHDTRNTAIPLVKLAQKACHLRKTEKESISCSANPGSRPQMVAMPFLSSHGCRPLYPADISRKSSYFLKLDCGHSPHLSQMPLLKNKQSFALFQSCLLMAIPPAVHKHPCCIVDSGAVRFLDCFTTGTPDAKVSMCGVWTGLHGMIISI